MQGATQRRHGSPQTPVIAYWMQQAWVVYSSTSVVAAAAGGGGGGGANRSGIRYPQNLDRSAA